MALSWTERRHEYIDETGIEYAVVIEAEHFKYDSRGDRMGQWAVIDLPFWVADRTKDRFFPTQDAACEWVEQSITEERIAAFAAFRASGGNPYQFPKVSVD